MNREVALALDYALSRGFQIHPGALKILEGVGGGEIRGIMRDLVREKSRQRLYVIGQDDLEALLGIAGSGGLDADYEVLSDPTPKITSAEGIDGYNALFASRFSKLRGIISDRPESKMIKTAASVGAAKPDGEVYVCGLVSEKSSERSLTKLVLDDPTGSVTAVVFDRELRETVDTILNDQFVMARMVAGRGGSYIIKDLIVPDVPDHRPNRSVTDAHAAFISDLHIGSKYFMESEFVEFVSWLSSADPVARKIRFLVICGDLVDGVGIYPNQDKELVCQTLEEQLGKTEEILSRIPERIVVFIIPGNHDPGRRAVPQPAIPRKYRPSLWEHENFVMLGNPATISLNGVRVTMFHGQSIDDIVKTTPGLSYGKPADVMQHLLKARHMSPIFGSQTPVAPESEDMMVIDDVPDIFHVGHVHVMELGTYRGVLLINAGTWQRQTPFQESVGQKPTPGLAVIVDLNSFKVSYKDFG